MSIESTAKFSKALQRIIALFAEKYQLTYAEIIGAMQMKILDVWDFAPKYETEEEEEEDDT